MPDLGYLKNFEMLKNYQVSPSTLRDVEAWFDPTDASSITKDGSGFVERWDSQLNGHYWQQPVLANKPQVVSGALGVAGQDSISWDGVNDYMQAGLSTFDNVVAKPCTIIAVLKPANIGAGSGQTFLSWNDNTGSLLTHYYSAGGATIGYPQVSSTTTTSIIPGDRRLTRQIFTANMGIHGNLHNSQLNTEAYGQEIGTAVAWTPITTTTGAWLGINKGAGVPGTSWYGGAMGDLVVGSRLFSEFETTCLINFLAAKWQLLIF